MNSYGVPAFEVSDAHLKGIYMTCGEMVVWESGPELVPSATYVLACREEPTYSEPHLRVLVVGLHNLTIAGGKEKDMVACFYRL